MITQDWAFMVLGNPRPQGKMVCYGRGGMHQLTHDNVKELDAWRDKVRAAALRWCQERADVHQPLDTQLTWSLERPAGHWGTGRNADRLKPSAPYWPATDLDVDKLTRAVLDALTATKQHEGIWPNDAQIIDGAIRKRYASMRGQTVLPPGSGPDWDDVLPCPGVVVRLYPKPDPREGR